jgi:undecaprenyl-diphosphatase
MVVPLILGKMAKDIVDPKFAVNSVEISPMIIGFVAAFVTGLLACTWMIKLVKNSKLSYFAYYCFVIGIISIIFGLGIISF